MSHCHEAVFCFCSLMLFFFCFFFFFSSRRRHTRLTCDWSSDVCSSDLDAPASARTWSAHWLAHPAFADAGGRFRSEERRVGKECRSRGGPYHLKKKKRNKKEGRSSKRKQKRGRRKIKDRDRERRKTS